MSLSAKVFPFSTLDAYKLNLLSLPYVHKQMKFSLVEEVLEEKGDFLVQLHDDETLILSVQTHKNVLEFPIYFCKDSDSNRIRLEFCEEEYRSLPEIIAEFSCSGSYFTAENEKIRLGRPVVRSKYAGRFGYGEIFKLQKDSYTITSSFIRSLRSCFTKLPNVQEELEKLVGLKYKHLVEIQDFKYYNQGIGFPPIILVRYAAYERSLFDCLKKLDYPRERSRYILWCYQAGKAISFLMNHGLFHRRLCTRACILDFNENLKLADYWTANDVEDMRLFSKIEETDGLNEIMGMHRDVWRFLPAESILGSIFTSASQVWCYGLLIWQIFTHGRFSNRIHYASLADFLSAKLEDDPYYMPGAISRQEANQGMPEKRRRMMAFYKASENFTSAPKKFNELIPKCLNKVPEDRPVWSELFSAVEAEYRITKLSFSLSKFI